MFSLFSIEKYNCYEAKVKIKTDRFFLNYPKYYKWKESMKKIAGENPSKINWNDTIERILHKLARMARRRGKND